MYTHAAICWYFFYICTYICILQLLIVFWATCILCDYSFITYFLNISCLCTCVYLYVCIYMCVYIRVTYTHRSRAYFYVYLRTISYASSSIYQHSLIHFNVDCLLVCVSCYPLICIRLCLCLCLYAMTASVPVLSIFFTVYIPFKRSILSETPQFAGSSKCSQEAFDATDNAIFLSTLDEPSFFWKCFDIFVVLLRVAVLMCNYLLSCACFLYCVYMHVSFTPVPVPLHFSFI